jgi:pyrroline-5-carboxylate reductase
MKTIGIIGYGNMGSAFYRGLAGSGATVMFAEKKEERKKALTKETGLEAVSLSKLVSASEIIIIAVKPQEIDALASELSSVAKGKKFISIIAGKPLAFFSERLQTDAVCRFMPNLAAMAGKAAVAVSFHASAHQDFKTSCLQIARAIGTPFEIPEKLMSAFTGLSGSGIAFVFAFVHALALGGVAAGIKYDEALAIALRTCEGAVAALDKTKLHPIELLSQVISPAGTTIEGVKSLEAMNFTSAVIKAVEDSAKRAAELEK